MLKECTLQVALTAAQSEFNLWHTHATAGPCSELMRQQCPCPRRALASAPGTDILVLVTGPTGQTPWCQAVGGTDL